MSDNSAINLIFEAAVVKRIQRTGWQILGDNHETVGEHTFMTGVIAYMLAKSMKGKVDMEKVMVMSLFHDFHESRIGDVDKIALEYITRDTKKANRDIFAGKDMELLESLTEYEAKDTIEAKIVYEANIIALLVELKILTEKGNIHAREWLDGNIKRLRIPEAQKMAGEIVSTDSHSWWKDIRRKLDRDFSQK
jgi:putative hydrolase of HD superfamily